MNKYIPVSSRQKNRHEKLYCRKDDGHKNVVIMYFIEDIINIYYFEPHTRCINSEKCDSYENTYKETISIILDELKDNGIPEHQISVNHNGNFQNEIEIQGKDELCQSWSMLYSIFRVVFPFVPNKEILKQINLENIFYFLMFIWTTIPLAEDGKPLCEQRIDTFPDQQYEIYKVISERNDIPIEKIRGHIDKVLETDCDYKDNLVKRLAPHDTRRKNPR